MKIFIDILILLFLDIILSVDNAILIASTTKEMEPKPQKWAQFIGASLAVLLRLVFIILIMLFLNVFGSVNTIYIVGGLVLVVIGWFITNESMKNEKEKEKSATSVLKAVAIILAGDIMLSFDNAFVIADISMEMGLNTGWTIFVITLALIVSLIILLFFAKQLALLMKNHPWMIFIAGWLLVSVGIELMLKDSLFNIGEQYHWLCALVAYISGAIIIGGKWFLFHRKKEEKNTQI